MTRPIIHGASRLALLLMLCVGFIGGALLFSHAHFFRAPQSPDTPPIYQIGLPPVW